MARKSMNSNTDPQAAANNTYNDLAGGQKNIDIGAKYLPIKLGEASWTTDATTARQCIAGSSIAIFNNSTTVYTITFGKNSSVVAGVVGAVDAGVAIVTARTAAEINESSASASLSLYVLCACRLRLSLASVQGDPEIVFLDEPSTGMDPIR